MKILRIAAWVVSLTLSMMLPAHAGPVAAAVGAVVGLLKAGGIAATLIKLAFGIAFQLGSSLLAKMSAKKQTQPGIVGQVQMGGDKSLSFIVGTYATAGHMEYVNSFGKVDDVENAVLTQVITLSDLPVQSIGNRVFVNGETCNRDPSIVTSSEAAKLGATSYPIKEYKYSRWWFTFLKYYLGDQTTADANLVAKFAGDERPWFSDMVGRGVAYVIATAEFERHLMTAIPAFRFEVQGIKLYDPRKDSRVGGNGSHRWGNEATYEWTDNPIVIVYNILRGIHYQGEFIWGGTVKLWGLPLSGWMAAMNECDILVQIENGQFEKQFRCGYEIRTLDQDPMDVIEELLKSCNGRISESGGIYSVRVGPPALPVAFLSDDEFVITKEREFDAFPGLENTFNGVTGTWPSPDAAWEMKDAPQRRFPEYEAEDEGRILLADVEFNAVPFANQVQRLMMALAKSNRRFRKHIVTLPPWAAVLDPFDVIALTSPKEGYQNKHFEIMGIDDQPNVTQVASINEVDPSDYDWNANRDTLPWSVGPLVPNWPAPQMMFGWNAQPAELKDATGTSRRPSIEVFFAANFTDVRAVRVVAKHVTTQQISFDGELSYGDPDYDNPSRSVILNGVFLNDEEYLVQGIYLPFSGRQTEWSEWIPVKTPDVRLGSKDLYPFDIPAFNQSLQDLWRNQNENVRRVENEVTRMTTALSDLGADSEFEMAGIREEIGVQGANYRRLVLVEANERKAQVTRLEELDAQLAGNIANVQEFAQATATEVEAISQTVTQTQAQVGAVSANGYFQVYSEAASSGALSRIVLSVSTSQGGVAVQGAIFLEAMSNGKSRAIFDADEVYWTNGAARDRPMAYINGELTLTVANIGTAFVDNIRSRNGALWLRGYDNYGDIRIFTI
ncbi:phage tail protein [Ochrobactrum sp. EDr1-4]|uniref:phage tail protein n=1 Tax=Ochrobactrum sp. EDr1-4 TaxID=3368622 RepID=UPI003BA2D316